ncbi:hypothetical protein FTX61_01875 [Nitriliruptoraceae bacterium ZYF776]|nr:hypothetical protein [Profundirhabdus halotolerans]
MTSALDRSRSDDAPVVRAPAVHAPDRSAPPAVSTPAPGARTLRVRDRWNEPTGGANRREGATVDLEHLTDRLSQGVEGLRDRTAEAVSGDGHSVFRALRGIDHRLDDIESHVARLDDLDDRVDLIAGVLTGGQDDDGKATTWPRRLFWLAIGAGIGAAAAYLADPDRGAARRDELTDQLGAGARELGHEATTAAQDAANRVQGAAVEAAKDALPEQAEPDPKLLEQRIKSHALGGRDDASAVVPRIDGPGIVALKGTVPSTLSEREVIAAVAEVDGVVDVRSELIVRS